VGGLDAPIVIERAADWRRPQASRHRCAFSPGLCVSSVAHPGLLLIFFFFVIVNRRPSLQDFSTLYTPRLSLQQAYILASLAHAPSIPTALTGKLF
jgi:hypothetical protein